jgi:hypothetical protein
MKKFTILMSLFCLTIMTGSAFAMSIDDALNKICPAQGKLAAVIMEERQNGETLTEMRLRTTKFPEGFVRERALDLVMSAYEISRYSTEEYKKRAIADFREEAEMFCYKNDLLFIPQEDRV